MVLNRGLSPAWRLGIVAAAVLVLGAGALFAQQPAPAAAPPASATPRAATAPTVSASARAATTAAGMLADQAAAEALLTTLADRQQQRRTAWLGIGLSCSRCSFHTEGKSLSSWVFSESPVLYQVDQGGPADRAGLRSGDTLVAINGRALTTALGGRAFANMTPGVAVRLQYRRDGRVRTARVVPTERPARTTDLAEAELVELARARQDAARTLTRTYQRDAERAQREVARAQQELERARDKELSDSSRLLIRQYLEQAQRALEMNQSPLLAMPTPPAVAAVPPVAAAPESGLFPAAPPGIPAAPAAPSPAAPAAPAPTPRVWTVVPPGGLRYSGRLGSTLIEARRPGGVDVIETGDSQVVLTGGDLSVRIALAPGLGPRARIVSSVGGWSVARTARGAVARGIRGYLVNPRLGRALGASSGILVLDVADGSQADSLGILPGDVLVELNFTPVVSLLPDDAPAGRPPRAVSTQQGATSAAVVRQHARRILHAPAAGRRPQVPAVPPVRQRQ